MKVGYEPPASLRELAVIRLVVAGKETPEIAARLGVTPQAIRTRKMRARNRGIRHPAMAKLHSGTSLTAEQYERRPKRPLRFRPICCRDYGSL